jgi:hypothetical protein
VGKPGVKAQKYRRFVMKNKLFFGMIAGAVLAIGLVLSGCDLEDKKTCDDENNCSAANNAYFCGRSGCAADTGNRCSCD